MVVIWGSRNRFKKVGSGEFYCPKCQTKRYYERKVAKTYFTLYFIPLFPIRDLGEFVECQTCRVTFKTDVLKLAAPKVVPRLTDVMNAARSRLDAGEPVEYLIRDMNIAGLERDMAATMIAGLIGQERKVCPTCSLSYAATVSLCLECKQPLPAAPS